MTAIDFCKNNCNPPMLIAKVAISFAKYKKNTTTVLCHTIFTQISKEWPK